LPFRFRSLQYDKPGEFTAEEADARDAPAGIMG
jgi:hypothetical protein